MYAEIKEGGHHAHFVMVGDLKSEHLLFRGVETHDWIPSHFGVLGILETTFRRRIAIKKNTSTRYS
jgi:hypothetical protein